MVFFSPRRDCGYFTSFTSGVKFLYFLVFLSLGLFFAGILVYLFEINSSVFIVAASWIASSCVIYLTYALKPITQPVRSFFLPLFGVPTIIYTATLSNPPVGHIVYPCYPDRLLSPVGPS